MRIIVTSDTHYHNRYKDILEYFVAGLVKLQPDCVILAGDVGERISGFTRMLELLQQLECPRLILAGNHDVWRDGQNDSEVLWSEILPNLTQQHGAIWLEGQNWSHDGIGVCGTIGWYDYSARAPEVTLTDEQYFAVKKNYMVDGELVNWQKTDIEFANEVGEAFSARLASLDSNPAIEKIVIATHVPVFPEAIERKPGHYSWNLTNAYFYNLTLGQRILNSSKVTHVISGHTHIGKSAVINGKIEMRVIAADYAAPAYILLEHNK